MRLSCKKGDPGFSDALIADRSLHIYLDGKDICCVCHTADEEQGTAHVYMLNDEGKKYYDPETDDVAQEILTGWVELKHTDSEEHSDAA